MGIPIPYRETKISSARGWSVSFRVLSGRGRRAADVNYRKSSGVIVVRFRSLHLSLCSLAICSEELQALDMVANLLSSLIHCLAKACGSKMLDPEIIAILLT